MPAALVQKIAREKGIPESKLEEKWEAAKRAAEKKFGDNTESDDFYAYTTRVFKNMIGMEEARK
ncbi:hypothetical protein GR7B_00059 [Vibrio phage vB_VcorM_GR7B]|nr:hypothetical protein GR7B_00059 [Vibrio phage vB_VcorM_GR7B]